MRRIYIACEGPTELAFVRAFLQPHVPASHLIGYLPGKLTSRSGRGRGGDIRYARIRQDLLNALRMDPSADSTTFFDYYALGKDFPENSEPRGDDPLAKAARIEEAVSADISRMMESDYNRRRFRCYISMHEFEALLFSNPIALADSIGHPEIAGKFQSISNRFPTPEHIDDSPHSAPSKRIMQLTAAYANKVACGLAAAHAVGLPSMLSCGPHFREWFEWLGGRP